MFSVSGQICGQATLNGIFAREDSAEKVSVYKGFRRFLLRDTLGAVSCSQSRRATNCATSRNYSSGLWSVGGRGFGRYNIIAHFSLFFKRKFEIHKKRLKFHLIITAEGGFVKTLKQSFNYIYIATQKSTCFVSSAYGIIIMYI